MKTLILFLAVIIATIGLLSCGSSPDDSTGQTPAVKKTAPPKAQPKPPEEETDEYAEDDYSEDEYTGDDYTDEESAEYEYEDEDADVPASGLIRTVEISPRPLHADDNIKIKVKTAAPLKENQSLKYKFWKNRYAMEETAAATLPANTCKKNDVIFADVTLYEDDEIAARKRTAMIPIINSPPEIEEVIMPEIRGPGTYEFKVKAKDADNDQMTFSLEPGEESTDLDLQIDAATGTVTCTLSENPPESMKFTIIADDGDEGGKTKKIVSMRFFKHPKKEKK
jgi:hypothetical protein